MKNEYLSSTDSPEEEAKKGITFDIPDDQIKEDESPELSPEVRLTGFTLNLKELDPDFVVPDCFTKDRKIGTGAYGKVYKVTHKPTGVPFAVKRFEGLFVKELRV
jgi:serine/threonine protein kinase